VAETDGTPRFRKSKPPKGGNGSGASSRNSRPNAKTRRAALRETLQNGAALESNSEDATSAVQVPDLTHGQDVVSGVVSQNVVKTTMPTVIRSESSSSDALADTYADARSANARSTAPLPGATPPASQTPAPAVRTLRPALGSTLRMELTVHNGDGSEPRIQLRTTAPLGRAGLSDSTGTPAATTIRTGVAPDDLHDPQSGSSTSQEGPKRARKLTTPGFAPAFPDPSGRAKFYTDAVAAERATQARFDGALRNSGSDDTGFSAKPSPVPSSTAPSLSSTGNAQRARRPPRPGERTLIMSRRPKKGSKRDWVFVVLLVAALGLTASMFLSQQAPAEEVVDASAYDDPQYQEESQDPFAQTTLRPWNRKSQDQDKEKPNSQSDTSALTAHAPGVAAAGVQATELRSMPAGAEVIAGNAVVGSTPVRVARGSTDMNYVLRLPGHESKTVRVGPHSPASILVELGPLAPAAPAPNVNAPAQAPIAPKGK
jgi:hypothetical protein